MSYLRRASCILLIAVFGLHGGATAHSQAPSVEGELSGVVEDPSGAKVPHAMLHVAGTGQTAVITRDLSTDSAGRFSVSLPAGSYTVTARFPGFQDYTATFRIAAGALTRLNPAFAIVTHTEQIAVPMEGSASTAAGDNASALVFQGAGLYTFSDDDVTFQKELLALAGGDSSQPPQIFVNGFSGARIPPKSSILSVRINRNSYSAAYDSFGIGRIEIATKPGGDRLHGQLNVNATDNVFNAQNPYLTTEPPYYLLNLDGNLSGSFNRKTSFFLSGSFNDQQNNAALNAITLNGANQQVPYSATVRDPQLTSTYGLRLDRQIAPANTLTSRYEFNQVNLTNGGLTAPLTTADQAFNSGTTTQTLQLSDTQIFGPHIVSESHLQYIRTRLQQNAANNTPRC